MPGLVGIFDMGGSGRIEPSVFQQMTSSLMHRARYRADAHVDLAAGVAVARVHQGVINPDPQPYVSEDGLLRVFLDGEVYNEGAAGQELKYVATAYRRHGLGFAAELNGSFAAIVHDQGEGRVLIATDRTASRPVFCWRDGPTLYVAPELKALLRVPGLERRPDWRAIAGFLAAGFWLNGYTPLDGVRRLDHATVLSLTRDGTSSHRYWDYRFDDGGSDRGERYYRGTLQELVRAAVRRQTHSAHRYGILLSGGYDSRGILGCYLHERSAAETVTISWGQGEQVRHSDCWVARRLAERVGTTHRFYPLRAGSLSQHLRETIRLSDGMTASFGNYPEGLAVFAAIRDELGVQVLLRGDECLGWHPGPFDERSMFRSLGIRALSDLSAYRTRLKPDHDRRLTTLSADLLAEISARCPAGAPDDRKDFFYLDQRLKYLLHPLNYLKTLEVDVRRPYLDNDILDFVSTLPVKYRLDKALFRRVIVDMFPHLFEEFARHGNLVDWHRQLAVDEDLRTFLQQHLSAPGTIVAEILATPGRGPRPPEVAAVRRHRRRLDVVTRGLRHYPWLHRAVSRQLYRLRQRLSAGDAASTTPDILFRLLTLALWSDTFLEDPSSRAEARPIEAGVV